MKEKVRVAIYSRKSKFSDKGDSVGNQVDISLKYIEKHFPNNKYEVDVVIFEDDGFSGGSFNRPKFKEFMIEENKNPFDILICYRLDRISRNIANFSNLMEDITKLGTSFVSIKEQFDTKTPMGRAMMYIASVFAQLEREVIRERIIDNMNELAKTGRWLGGITPTGFSTKRGEFIEMYEETKLNSIEKKNKKVTKLVEIKEEIELVQKIFYKFLELKSLTKLETYLIQNSILTKNNLNFDCSSLRRILKNPVYAPNDIDILKYFKNRGVKIYADGERANFNGKYGLIAYGKLDKDISKWIISVGVHSPVIKKGKDWIRVQKLLEKNEDRRYGAKCKHDCLFSGILRCKKCGSFMRPKMSKDSRFYYICELKEKTRKLRCDGKNINGLNLDKLVIEKIDNIFVPWEKIVEELQKIEIQKNINSIKSEKEKLEKKIKINNNVIKKLLDKLKFIDEEVVDIVNSELKRIKKDNENLIERLKVIEERKILKDGEKNELILSLINNRINSFNDLDIKSKKDFLKAIIYKMEGNGENIEIKLFNRSINEVERLILIDDIKCCHHII